MKKIVWMITIALMAFGMVSCEKDKSEDQYVYPQTIAEAKLEVDVWGELAYGISDWLLYENNDPVRAGEVNVALEKAKMILKVGDATLEDYCRCIDLLHAACKPYLKMYFYFDRQRHIDDLEDLLRPDDSEECRQIIHLAQAAMRQVSWNNSKPDTQFFDLAGALYLIEEKAEEDLERQREKEERD